MKTRDEMRADGYPGPRHELYLVFELGEERFMGKAYHFPDLRAENVQPLHNRLRDDRLPFTLSLAELASLREVLRL